MKKRVEHESKSAKTPKDPVQIPSRENFDTYFTEFYKMFQHCKYNLVALNKRFDTFEKFFKNYLEGGDLTIPSMPVISSGTGGGGSSRFEKMDAFGGDSGSDSYEIEKADRNKKPTSKKKPPQKKKTKRDDIEENEENFPISMEDLEFLTRNYVPDESPMLNKKRSINGSFSNSQTHSLRKKPTSSYDVIVINKRKMIVEDNHNIASEIEIPEEFEYRKENNLMSGRSERKNFGSSSLSFGKTNFHGNNNNFSHSQNIQNNFNLEKNINFDSRQQEKSGFNQKLFDYKNFSANNKNLNSINSINTSALVGDLNSLIEAEKKKEENKKLSEYNKNHNLLEDNKWIIKSNNQSDVGSKENKEKDSCLNKENLENPLSPNFTLSTAELNAISNFGEESLNSLNKNNSKICNDLSSNNSNSGKKQTSFSEFIKQKKEKLVVDPHLVKKTINYEKMQEELNNKEFNSK